MGDPGIELPEPARRVVVRQVGRWAWEATVEYNYDSTYIRRMTRNRAVKAGRKNLKRKMDRDLLRSNTTEDVTDG